MAVADRGPPHAERVEPTVGRLGVTRQSGEKSGELRRTPPSEVSANYAFTRAIWNRVPDALPLRRVGNEVLPRFEPGRRLRTMYEIVLVPEIPRIPVDKCSLSCTN